MRIEERDGSEFRRTTSALSIAIQPMARQSDSDLNHLRRLNAMAVNRNLYLEQHQPGPKRCVTCVFPSPFLFPSPSSDSHVLSLKTQNLPERKALLILRVRVHSIAHLPCILSARLGLTLSPPPFPATQTDTPSNPTALLPLSLLLLLHHPRPRPRPGQKAGPKTSTPPLNGDRKSVV